MTTIHIISDLYLGFNEKAEEELEIPDVDIVVINGNIGHPKRAMVYIEELCRRYPDTVFIYNAGYLERFMLAEGKFTGENVLSEKLRSLVYDKYPKNLHFLVDETKIIKTRYDMPYDICAVFGFPRILNVTGKWEDLWYYKHVSERVAYDELDNPEYHKPEQSSYVPHGSVAIMASVDYINKQHDVETDIVKKWELTPNHPKILITHMHPLKDTRNTNLAASPYQIHLNEGLWITSNVDMGKVMFVGANLVSNPGRGLKPRSNIIEF